MRVPKQSPWKISEPASFRQWMKKSMTPLGYDKALKRKEKLAVLYFFMSFITLNMIAWDYGKSKEESPNVEPENPVLQEYLKSSLPEDGQKAYIYNYENLKFKSAEVINVEEMEKMRREGTSE